MDGLTLIVATTNRHKIEEIEAVMGGYGFRIIGRAEAGAPDIEVEETGATFEENAILKAEAIVRYTGGTVMAEDSGLMVDALDGAPGVYSARFAAEHEHMSNNEKLIRLLAEVPDEQRTARFVSVVALLLPRAPKSQKSLKSLKSMSESLSENLPEGLAHPLWTEPAGYERILLRGECEGRISHQIDGVSGFGYDPVFIPRAYDKAGTTFARLTAEEKNAVSHRGSVLEKLRRILISLRFDPNIESMEQ